MTEHRTAYVPVSDPKGTREALCAAQSALAERAAAGVDTGSVPRWIEHLDELVREIDQHRPLGPDGKHGDRHTPTCGCEREGGGATVTAPEPPAVWWSPATDSLYRESSTGFGYVLMIGHSGTNLPDDAVRLVPDEPRHEVACPTCGATIRARMADASQVGRCGVRTPRLYPAQRLADVPVCTLPAGHAGWHRDADTGAEWGQMRDEHPGAAAPELLVEAVYDLAALWYRIGIRIGEGGPLFLSRTTYDGPSAEAARADVRALLGGADNNNEGERRG